MRNLPGTMFNIQPIEHFVPYSPGGALYVHSIFSTIQGEGPLTGHPAIFVRLAGCNLQCPQCDTDYTSKRELLSPEAILARVRALHPGPRLVVITGGEPFRQQLQLLLSLLDDEDYQIQIESNGTLQPCPIPPDCWIVVSPKTGKVHPAIREMAVAWKYVLNHFDVDPDDGLPTRALMHPCSSAGLARPSKDFPIGAIYLQPADPFQVDVSFDRMVEHQRNLDAAKASCMKFGYTLQLQLHKLISME